MLVGVEVIFKADDKKEWIDPVVRSEADEAINSNSEEVVFNNGQYDYKYLRGSVKEFVIYELCPNCGYDIRTEQHSKDCIYYER